MSYDPRAHLATITIDGEVIEVRAATAKMVAKKARFLLRSRYEDKAPTTIRGLVCFEDGSTEWPMFGEIMFRQGHI